LRSDGFSDYTDNDHQKVTLMVRCEDQPRIAVRHGTEAPAPLFDLAALHTTDQRARTVLSRSGRRPSEQPFDIDAVPFPKTDAGRKD
jgi:hypothetical protein